ncbi:MAG: AAA family ATPase [Actinomycetota bacterium]
MVMVERALCPVLVGRSEELSILEDALLAANRGQGSVVALAGDAGLGKTRLATELERRARSIGSEVLSGGCSEADLSLPYLPLLEAIGNYLAGADLDSVRARLGPSGRELAQLFPQLDPSGTPVQDAETTQSKLRLFEAMIALLGIPADQHGLLLIVEDLHWADASTRELLDYMTRRLRQMRIMVLATYRRDEMHRKHPLAPIVQGWRRSGGAQVIELEPLDGDQVSSMVRAIFDVDHVSDEFRDFIHERSEGNPFVLEEMLKEAIDCGDLYRSETGEWERKDLAHLAIPRSVADNIMGRVERMDPDHADVLRGAAVLGPSFEYEALVSLTQLSEQIVQAALTSCVQQQLIVGVERSPGVYRFRHALTREAVYEDLILPKRQQLHARAAAVLKARPGTPAVDIASHLLAAGDYEGAVPLCLSAADEAMAAVAFPEACELWERCLEYITDEVQRGRVLTSLGHAYTVSSEPARAQRYLHEAVRLFERLGNKGEEAKARLWLGRTYWEQTQVARSKEEYERARAILEEAGPSEDLANAYVRLAGLAVFDFDEEGGVRLAEAAIATAEQAGTDQPRVWAYNFLGVSLLYQGEVEEGLASLTRSYDQALARGWYFIASNALHNILASCTGYTLMAKEMPPFLDKLDALPATVWPVGPSFRRGLNDLALGKIVVAKEELETALAHARQLGLPTVAGWAESGLCYAMLERGDLDKARSFLHPLDPTAERQELRDDVISTIEVSVEAGEPEAAAAAARLASQSGTWYLRRAALARACVVALIAVGALDEAGDIAEAIEVRHEPSERPYADVAQGALALARGDAPLAKELLSRGAQAFMDAEYRVEEMRARLDLAEALATLGERDAAQQELDCVVRVGSQFGAALRVQQARALADRLGLRTAIAEQPAAETPAPRGELVETAERLVSVMFADVRGYTSMTNERAPADMVDRIGSFHRWAQQEIEKRGGLVDKFAGDAVMATFNVSGRALDHAERALDAGMAVQDKAAMMGLPVGVGIAVGAAIIGRFAEGANVSVIGETTNLAARLQGTAGAGEVVLSEEAYRRTKSFLESRGLTTEPVTVELKGFDAPVSAFVVRARA